MRRLLTFALSLVLLGLALAGAVTAPARAAPASADSICYAVRLYNDSSRSVRVALTATSGGHTINPGDETVGQYRYVVVPSGDRVYVTTTVGGATTTYGPGTHRVTKWGCSGHNYEVGRYA